MIIMEYLDQFEEGLSPSVRNQNNLYLFLDIIFFKQK
jgi:hypothetical protein